MQGPLRLSLRTGMLSLLLLSIGQRKSQEQLGFKSGELDSTSYGRNCKITFYRAWIERMKSLGNVCSPSTTTFLIAWFEEVLLVV